MAMTAMLDEAVFPAGFHREHRLGNGDFGEVWSGRASGEGSGPGIPRVIRVLPPSAFAQHDFREALYHRVARLKSLPLPFISVPTHVESLGDGSVAVVEPDLQMSLARWISSGRKLDPAELERWTEQILTGLASLHAAKLAHGDIRFGNVFLIDGEGTAHRMAWVGDAAVGPLTCWSRGALMNGDAAQHRPPEWGNEWREPEPRADLYALGVTLWKLLCPGKALPRSDPGTNRSRQIRRSLQGAASSRPVRDLIRRLLAADPQERPENAGSALRLFRRLERHDHRRPWLTVSVIGVSLAVLAGTVAWQRGAEASRLDSEIQSVRKELTNELDRSGGLERQFASAREASGSLESALKRREDELTARNQELVARVEEINDLKRKVAELRKDPLPKVVSPLFDEQELAARKLWQETIRRSDPPQRQLELVGQAIAKSDKDARVLQHLSSWEKESARLVALTREWARVDDVLLERVRQFAHEPWNAESQSEARKRLESLHTAAVQWKLWAESPKLKPDDIEKQLSHEPLRSNETGKILSRWWADMQPGKRPQWTLRLIRGRSEKSGNGTTRVVGVHGTEWVYTDKHDWQDPQKHEYPDDETSRIRFEWKPGEPTGLCLEGERRYVTFGITRPYLIQANDLFQGPLALWLMQSWGSIEHNGFVLECEILDCPGPPPSLLQKLEATMKAATSSLGAPAP